MQYRYRKLTKQELEELKGYVSISTKILRGSIFFLISLVLSYFFSQIMKLLGVNSSIGIVFFLILIIFYFYNQDKWTGGKKFYDSVKLDIENNRCRLIVVYLKTVIKIKESENEGSCYIVKDIDGKFLFLSGQELSLYEENGFPWSSFIVKESINAKVEFGIEKNSQSINVNQVLPTCSVPLDTMKKIGAFKKMVVFLTDENMELLKKEILVGDSIFKAENLKI